MTELDKIRAEIADRRDRWENESRVANHRHALAAAELEAHDRAVAAMSTAPPAPAAETRNSIQRPVMALFILSTDARTADSIIEETGLPEGAVRKFLARAVKGGMLALRDDGFYRLPAAKGPGGLA